MMEIFIPFIAFIMGIVIGFQLFCAKEVCEIYKKMKKGNEKTNP